MGTSSSEADGVLRAFTTCCWRQVVNTKVELKAWWNLEAPQRARPLNFTSSLHVYGTTHVPSTGHAYRNSLHKSQIHVIDDEDKESCGIHSS